MEKLLVLFLFSLEANSLGKIAPATKSNLVIGKQVLTAAADHSEKMLAQVLIISKAEDVGELPFSVQIVPKSGNGVSVNYFRNASEFRRKECLKRDASQLASKPGRIRITENSDDRNFTKDKDFNVKNEYVELEKELKDLNKGYAHNKIFNVKEETNFNYLDTENSLHSKKIKKTPKCKSKRFMVHERSKIPLKMKDSTKCTKVKTDNSHIKSRDLLTISNLVFSNNKIKDILFSCSSNKSNLCNKRDLSLNERNFVLNNESNQHSKKNYIIQEKQLQAEHNNYKVSNILNKPPIIITRHPIISKKKQSAFKNNNVLNNKVTRTNLRGVDFTTNPEKSNTNNGQRTSSTKEREQKEIENRSSVYYDDYYNYDYGAVEFDENKSIKKDKIGRKLLSLSSFQYDEEDSSSGNEESNYSSEEKFYKDQPHKKAKNELCDSVLNFRNAMLLKNVKIITDDLGIKLGQLNCDKLQVNFPWFNENTANHQINNRLFDYKKSSLRYFKRGLKSFSRQSKLLPRAVKNNDLMHLSLSGSLVGYDSGKYNLRESNSRQERKSKDDTDSVLEKLFENNEFYDIAVRGKLRLQRKKPLRDKRCSGSKRFKMRKRFNGDGYYKYFLGDKGDRSKVRDENAMNANGAKESSSESFEARDSGEKAKNAFAKTGLGKDGRGSKEYPKKFCGNITLLQVIPQDESENAGTKIPDEPDGSEQSDTTTKVFLPNTEEIDTTIVAQTSPAIASIETEAVTTDAGESAGTTTEAFVVTTRKDTKAKENKKIKNMTQILNFIKKLEKLMQEEKLPFRIANEKGGIEIQLEKIFIRPAKNHSLQSAQAENNELNNQTNNEENVPSFLLKSSKHCIKENTKNTNKGDSIDYETYGDNIEDTPENADKLMQRNSQSDFQSERIYLKEVKHRPKNDERRIRKKKRPRRRFQRY